MNRSGAACFCENKPATPKVGYLNSKLVCKSPILCRSVVRAVVGAVQRHRRPGTTGRLVRLHSVPPAPSSNPKRVAVVLWLYPSPLTYTYIHTYILYHGLSQGADRRKLFRRIIGRNYW